MAPAKKRQKSAEDDNAAGGEDATDAPQPSGADTAEVAQMMAEIAGLKASLDAWQTAFRVRASGDGAIADDEDAPEIDPESARARMDELESRHDALAAALLEKQTEIADLRRAAQHMKASIAPDVRRVRSLLIDPGLARQFRQMQSEVDQGREMMREMQDELVAVTYSRDAYESKQQASRLRQLERENEELRRALKDRSVASLSNQNLALTRQLDEVHASRKALQEYTRTLDKDFQALKAKHAGAKA